MGGAQRQAAGCWGLAVVPGYPGHVEALSPRMQIAPLPVNHAGMRGEDMATAIAWYRPSWAAI